MSREGEEQLLIEEAKRGDERALERLLVRYRFLVRARARRYYMPGWEQQDVFQEGLIGLFKAIRDYKPEGGVSFESFAYNCIKRHVTSAVKASNRKSHTLLNNAVQLSDGDPIHPASVSISHPARGSTELEPLHRVLFAERAEYLIQTLTDELTEFECHVLHRYTQGHTFKEISAALDRPIKSIYNAIQRSRTKLEATLQRPAG